ncbi:uncharacterized protein [Fopius arisanus]|uniref:Uncharacterized protein n=1 Tax=Fopius arisanus TaxID=64838 RepID=A0A9R1TPP2_9HYME|nr:PREDICTED: uncharacterized protein LOC105272814 [Fopius arisanus]
MIPDSFKIDFSTDGATLDAQQKIQMWPIQIRIANIPRCKPEIVGVWRGSSKPTNAHEFLDRFINDFLEVNNNGGIVHNDKLCPTELRCFIADAPARAFILAHLGHTGAHPCSKCWIKGDSIRRGVTAFRGVAHRPRTDQEYADRIDGEHHSDIDSPLLRLPMGLVTQVPFDYMHCVCLGITKKILSVLVKGILPKNGDREYGCEEEGEDAAEEQQEEEAEEQDGDHVGETLS